jgi:isopentenyldiphosphate isomerase
MEFLDIYDIDRQPTGCQVSRNASLPAGQYRLAVHVNIFNSDGKMLIQQRREDDAHWPGLWDISVGGCALCGESSRQAAHRETLEELGLDINFESVRPFMTVNFKYGFDDEYIILHDCDISSIHFQENEISRIKWADQAEIFAMIDEGKFISYHKEFIGLMFKNAWQTNRDIISR